MKNKVIKLIIFILIFGIIVFLLNEKRIKIALMKRHLIPIKSCAALFNWDKKIIEITKINNNYLIAIARKGILGSSLHMYKLNENGKLIWKKILDFNEKHICNIQKNRDFYKVEYYKIFPSGEGREWSLKIDKNGHIMSKNDRYLSHSEIEFCEFLSLKLTGNTNYNNGIDIKTSNGKIHINSKGLFKKYDKNYEKIEEKYLSISYKFSDYKISKLKVIKNGFVIVREKYNLGFVGDTTFALDLNGVIEVYDYDGNLKWSKEIGGNNHDYINDVTSLSNGDIIAVGYTSSYGVGKSNMWVVKFDENGIKWNKAFGEKDKYSEAIMIKNINDEYFIVVGTNCQKETVIMKIDKDGNKIWETFLDIL